MICGGSSLLRAHRFDDMDDTMRANDDAPIQ